MNARCKAMERGHSSPQAAWNKTRGQKCPRSAFTGLDLIAVVSACVILVVLGQAARMRARSQAQMKVCQNNLGQIGKAVLEFAHENGSKLPGALQTQSGDPWWFYKEQVKIHMGLTTPSSEEDRAFACPVDRGYSDPGPFCKNSRFDYSSYVLNAVTLNGAPNIAGWGISEISEPKKTLLAMEWCAHAPLSWHRSRTGKANAPFYCDAEGLVVFVDGHAEMIPIYYDGFNAAYTRDPIAGYRYRYSGR